MMDDKEIDVSMHDRPIYRQLPPENLRREFACTALYRLFVIA